MRTPAFALAYAQWCRHRWSFIAALATLVVTAAVCPFLFAQGRAEALGLPIAASALPLFAVYALTLNSLLFVNEAGNFSSSYPKAMLTLPVRSHTLAVAPIAFGSLTAGSLWIATAMLVYRPLGLDLPLLVPALGSAALMACVQTVAWMPLAKGWVSEIVRLVIMIALPSLAVAIAVTVRDSQMLLSTLLAGSILASLALGQVAVSTNRRGGVWALWPSLGRKAQAVDRAKPERRPRPLASPAKAQFWYEWNCHGWVAPAYVGIVFFNIIGLLVWRGALEGAWLFGWIFTLVLSLPIIMAGATGPSLGRLRPFWVKDSGAITFLATRPVSSSSLAAAKFQMALVSSLFMWAFVIIGITFWVLVSNNLDNARHAARLVFARFTRVEGVTIVIAMAVLLAAITWRQLTDSFALVLTGRRWIVESSVTAGVALVLGLTCGAFYLFNHQEYLSRFLAAAPWMAAILAVFKSSVAIAAFGAALRRGLLKWRSVACLALVWLGLSGAGSGVAVLMTPVGTIPVPTSVVCISVAAIMPLCRFPLAILAVDWNRHR